MLQSPPIFYPIEEVFEERINGTILKMDGPTPVPSKFGKNRISRALGYDKDGEKYVVILMFWQSKQKEGHALWRERIQTYKFDSVIDALERYEHWDFMIKSRTSCV